MPTHREMRDYMEVTTTSSIFDMLGQIEWKGYIKKHPAQARAIEIKKDIE
jgi:hypothetical protein